MATDSAPITSEERWSAEELALLEALPPTFGGRIRTLLRDRDHYLALHAALIDVERATSLDERLRIFVHAIHSIGFGRVGIAIREGDHDGPRCIAVGMEQHEVLALSDLRHGDAEWGAGGTHVLPLRTPAGHRSRRWFSAIRRMTAVGADSAAHDRAVRPAGRPPHRADPAVRAHGASGGAPAATSGRGQRARAVARRARDRARGRARRLAAHRVRQRRGRASGSRARDGRRRWCGSSVATSCRCRKVPLGDGVIARVARTGSTGARRGAASCGVGAHRCRRARRRHRKRPSASLLAVPLRVGLRLVAVLAVASGRRDAFAR